MTEYWQSFAKHYCKICKIWVDGHQKNIDRHHGSKFHRENEKKAMKEAEQRHIQRQKDDKENEKILRDMERAANKAMMNETGIGVGGAFGNIINDNSTTSAGATSAGASSSRSNNNSIFIPTNQFAKKNDDSSTSTKVLTRGVHDFSGGGLQDPSKLNEIQLKNKAEEERKRKELEELELEKEKKAAEAQLEAKRKQLEDAKRRRIAKSWVCLKSASDGKNTASDYYYFNTLTNERQFERPEDVDEEFDDQPRVWCKIECKTEDKSSSEGGETQSYFYNGQTGETTYEEPEELRILRQKRKRVQKDFKKTVLAGGWEIVDEETSKSLFGKKLDVWEKKRREDLEREEGLKKIRGENKTEMTKEQQMALAEIQVKTKKEHLLDDLNAMKNKVKTGWSGANEEDLILTNEITVTKASLYVDETDIRAGSFAKRRGGGAKNKRAKVEED